MSSLEAFDWDLKFWLVKSVLDHLIVPSWFSWSTDFSGSKVKLQLICWFCSLEVTMIPWWGLKKGLDCLIQLWSWSQMLYNTEHITDYMYSPCLNSIFSSFVRCGTLMSWWIVSWGRWVFPFLLMAPMKWVSHDEAHEERTPLWGGDSWDYYVSRRVLPQPQGNLISTIILTW